MELQDEGWRPSITVKNILTGIQVCALAIRGLPFVCKPCAELLGEASAWRQRLAPDCANEGCVQDLLNDPNPKSPAQAEAFMLFTNQKAEYKRRVKEQAKRNPVPS